MFISLIVWAIGTSARGGSNTTTKVTELTDVAFAQIITYLIVYPSLLAAGAYAVYLLYKDCVHSKKIRYAYDLETKLKRKHDYVIPCQESENIDSHIKYLTAMDNWNKVHTMMLMIRLLTVGKCADLPELVKRANYIAWNRVIRFMLLLPSKDHTQVLGTVAFKLCLRLLQSWRQLRTQQLHDEFGVGCGRDRVRGTTVNGTNPYEPADWDDVIRGACYPQTKHKNTPPEIEKLIRDINNGKYDAPRSGDLIYGSSSKLRSTSDVKQVSKLEDMIYDAAGNRLSSDNYTPFLGETVAHSRPHIPNSTDSTSDVKLESTSEDKLSDLSYVKIDDVVDSKTEVTSDDKTVPNTDDKTTTKLDLSDTTNQTLSDDKTKFTLSIESDDEPTDDKPTDDQQFPDINDYDNEVPDPSANNTEDSDDEYDSNEKANEDEYYRRRQESTDMYKTLTEDEIVNMIYNLSYSYIHDKYDE